MYDFPNRTVTQVSEGVPLELNMKNQFQCKRLIPATTPAQLTNKSDQSAPQTTCESSSAATVNRFCSNCGAKLHETARFCSSCGVATH